MSLDLEAIRARASERLDIPLSDGYRLAAKTMRSAEDVPTLLDEIYHLADVANSGVESETRKYRVVQVDNDVWAALEPYRGERS